MSGGDASSLPYYRFSGVGASIRYPKLDTCCLKLTSVLNVCLWVTCTAIHTSILIAFEDFRFQAFHLWSNIDIIGWGIWGGLLFGISGLLGLTGAAQRSRSLLLTTILFALLAMGSAVASCILSFIAGTSLDCSYYDNYPSRNKCKIWFALEWTLFTLNFVAFFLNMASLILVSKGICNCCHSETELTVPIISRGQQAQQFYYSTSHTIPATTNARNLMHTGHSGRHASANSNWETTNREMSPIHPPTYTQATAQVENYSSDNASYRAMPTDHQIPKTETEA